MIKKLINIFSGSNTKEELNNNSDDESVNSSVGNILNMENNEFSEKDRLLLLDNNFNSGYSKEEEIKNTLKILEYIKVNNKKVLLVEDKDEELENIKKLFGDIDGIKIVSTFSEAEKVLEKESIDIVLTDLFYPQGNINSDLEKEQIGEIKDIYEKEKENIIEKYYPQYESKDNSSILIQLSEIDELKFKQKQLKSIVEALIKIDNGNFIPPSGYFLAQKLLEKEITSIIVTSEDHHSGTASPLILYGKGVDRLNDLGGIKHESSSHMSKDGNKRWASALLCISSEIGVENLESMESKVVG